MSVARGANSGGLKILVVGGGGREHALEWALARSPRTARICGWRRAMPAIATRWPSRLMTSPA